MITQDRLKEMLLYNPDTGVFTWRVSPSNRIRQGSIAGYVADRGYRYIAVDEKMWREHRLAFLYMSGKLPKVVDHINGIRDDNRWVNLREGTQSQNMMNTKINPKNKSGVKGVCWHKASKKWIAQLRVKGKSVNIGYFSDISSAELAVRAAREKYHGEFANHG